MAEKNIVVEKAVVKYEGLLNIKKFYLEIDRYIRQMGYDRMEHKNYEQVTETGKEIYIQIRPWKTFSDYVKSEHKIEMHFIDIKDVEIEKNGVKEIMQKGIARFTFQARLITDHEGKWEGTPFYLLLRTFMDKFVYKTQISAFAGECKADSAKIQDEIKSYLNLYRYLT